MGRNQVAGAVLFSLVPGGRMRGNGLELEHRKVYLNTRKSFTLRMAER